MNANTTIYANWTAVSSGGDITSNVIEWNGTTNTLPNGVTTEGNYSFVSEDDGKYSIVAQSSDSSSVAKIFFPSDFGGNGAEMEVSFTAIKGANATWEHGFMLLNGASSTAGKNRFTDAHVQNNKMWFGTNGTGDYVATYDNGSHTINLVCTGSSGYAIYDGVQKPQAVRETADTSSYFWFRIDTIKINSFKITKP